MKDEIIGTSFMDCPPNSVKQSACCKEKTSTNECSQCRHIYVFRLSIFSNHLASVPRWFTSLICSELNIKLELHALWGNQRTAHMYKNVSSKCAALN